MFNTEGFSFFIYSFMKKYTYKKCSRCRLDKYENRNPYCRPCSREYHSLNKKYKQVKIDINKDGLEYFINKIKKQALWIDFDDINNILFFYELITDNIHEYSVIDGEEVPGGEQIKLMWDDILLYHLNQKRK